MSFQTRCLLDGLVVLLVATLLGSSAVALLVRYRATHPAQAHVLPTPRGTVAFLIPMLASLLYPGRLPGRVSTLGDWQFGWPVSSVSRVLGAWLILACVAACMEALRRGSRIDRVMACASGIFTYLFIYEVLKSYFYTVRP